MAGGFSSAWTGTGLGLVVQLAGNAGGALACRTFGLGSVAGLACFLLLVGAVLEERTAVWLRVADWAAGEVMGGGGEEEGGGTKAMVAGVPSAST